MSETRPRLASKAAARRILGDGIFGLLGKFIVSILRCSQPKARAASLLDASLTLPLLLPYGYPGAGGGSAPIAGATTLLRPLPPLCYHHPMTPSSHPPAAATRTVNQPKTTPSRFAEKKVRQTNGQSSARGATSSTHNRQ